MSATLVVRHNVHDYAAWRKVYDELEPLRAQHGCTGSASCGFPMMAMTCSSPTTSRPPSRRPASRATRACGPGWSRPESRAHRGSRSSRMSDPRPLRPGRGSRPSPASLGVVRVDADFQDEYPGGDTTCTEAYASLCRTGEALLGELDRRIALTFDMHQAAATALAVIDGAAAPLTPSQVSDRVLIASATMTATLDLLERRGWIRRTPNPGDRRSVLDRDHTRRPRRRRSAAPRHPRHRAKHHVRPHPGRTSTPA